ncbi:MAG: hypothetical protein IPF77_13210 [Gemmatimonadetes bacterium]|nr:hypothetical protein [Gemmatimonadota bacterium]
MSVPIQRIWLDAAESGDKPVSEQDLLPVSEVLPIALKLVAALTDSAGMSQDAARRAVLATEPFASYPALTELEDVMDRQQALEIGQIMLAGRKASGQVVTPEVIREVVSDVAVVAPIAKFEGDRIWLTEELERRFKVFVGKGIILEDRSDHVEWLSVRSKEILWQYWPRYRTFLARSMAPESIDRLAELTDDILGRLEDPRRPGAWSRRGLVVGHVQSGKTANYVGLTCKAADAGYKLVVVLAGIHNSLRAQTQMRLEEGFVGYGQEGNPLLGGPKMAVGVGLLDPSLVANAATSRANNGDFNAAVASNWGIHRTWHPAPSLRGKEERSGAQACGRLGPGLRIRGGVHRPEVCAGCTASPDR